MVAVKQSQSRGLASPYVVPESGQFEPGAQALDCLFWCNFSERGLPSSLLLQCVPISVCSIEMKLMVEVDAGIINIFQRSETG